MYKTYKKDFEYWRRRCLVHIDELHLGNYNYYFVHGKVVDGALACMAWEFGNDTGDVVALFLNPDWGVTRPTRNNLDIVAYHEVCHVLFRDTHILLARYYARDYIDEVEHRIIRRLEKSKYGIGKSDIIIDAKVFENEYGS